MSQHEKLVYNGRQYFKLLAAVIQRGHFTFLVFREIEHLPKNAYFVVINMNRNIGKHSKDKMHLINFLSFDHVIFP